LGKFREEMNVKYHCENGAWHNVECCMTCYNKHPNAVKGEWNARWLEEKINGQRHDKHVSDFRRNARDAGFNKEQIDFLQKYCML